MLKLMISEISFGGKPDATLFTYERIYFRMGHHMHFESLVCFVRLSTLFAAILVWSVAVDSLLMDSH